MKSLLIIKKRISSLKAELQYHKNLLSFIDDDAIEDVLLHIFYLEENIKILEQIKLELDAWYSVKSRLRINDSILEMKFLTKLDSRFSVIQKAMNIEE